MCVRCIHLHFANRRELIMLASRLPLLCCFFPLCIDMITLAAIFYGRATSTKGMLNDSVQHNSVFIRRFPLSALCSYFYWRREKISLHERDKNTHSASQHHHWSWIFLS